jgi:hypothetical protein
VETNFEYWSKNVLNNRVNTVKQTAPTAIFLYFDDGYACYVYADTPLKFDHQVVVDHTNPPMGRRFPTCSLCGKPIEGDEDFDICSACVNEMEREKLEKKAGR